MKKELKVKLTLEWTFDQKAWSDEQKHLENLQSDPNIVLGYDTLNTLFILNDITYPEVINYKVTDA
tara:strand:+ start:187 stop:384 length:198 start_codon:yes stop_codon:yes gene_type:complete